MSSIRTYEDLEAEERRLQALLYSHKANMQDSFASVKDGLNPFKQAASTVRKLFSGDKSNPLMSVGVGLGLDVLLRKFVLVKAGWFTKILVPFFVRNYSSHFINASKNNNFLQKIGGFFKKFRKDDADATEEDVDSTTQQFRQSESNIT